VGPY